MSSNDTQSALNRAYELVEAGKYDEARAILEPMLTSESDNADLWWIYAHAVRDANAGRDALENVLRIDPNYPGAPELLEQAQALATPASKPKIKPVAPATMPESPETIPEPDFAEPVAEAPTSPRTAPRPAVAQPPRRSGISLIAVVVVIVIALVVVFVITQIGGAPAATPTPTAIPVAAAATSTEPPVLATTEEASVAPTEVMSTEVMPTEPPTRAPTVTPTLAGEQATAETTGIDYAAIEAALSEFPIAESGVGVVQTTLGDTLMVSACTTQGRAMRTLLPQVMNALAKQSPSLDSSVQAIGARMLDCEQNSPLVTVAVDLATAQSYAQGNLDDGAFAATWQPQ